ncbi:MAG: apolipoprotein N-acyltransferase, partial [Ignavibacteria bacterium]|nr:apolipoprotein N-acyltransferase [Ignavibacteria bacterium]
HFGHRVSLIAFPFLWVGYEYTHSLSEWSFPWITIGNSQSYDIAQMQFISSTGVYGLSLWVLVINVLLFVLYSKLAQRVWQPLSRKSLGFLLVILFIYFIPKIEGMLILSKAPPYADPISEGENRVTVGMIQSNIDPWEKWKQSGVQAIELYLDLTRSLVANSAHQRPDLVLWPETAVPYRILAPENRETLNYLRQKLDEIGVPVLTGLPHAVYYDDSTQAPPSAKRNKKTGQRYDVFNAAAFIQPGVKEIPWYGKMKMVPIAERFPYADAFYFLDFLRWGVGIGGWQIGPDSTIFEDKKADVRFSSMICYESTYPDFVAAFVKKGAEFITIITIDSWWGRMSGAYQHQQFAIFRAVENRRWIARCAVGGISCYIDPYGRVYDKTDLFTQTTLIRTIGRSDELTFYAEHGDWLGVGCLFCGGLFVAAAVGQWFKNKRRMASWESSG